MQQQQQQELILLNLISRCYDSTGTFDQAAFRAKFSVLPSIPLTRKNLATGRLTTGTIVEYRGMVQDMFDPELFCTMYTDSEGSERSGLFRDFFPSEWIPNEHKLGEREVMYLVPVPGETKWASDMANPRECTDEREELPTGQRLTANKKRQLEDDCLMETEEDEVSSSKRTKDDTTRSQQQPTINLEENHPIPEDKQVLPPCMIKLYDVFQLQQQQQPQRRRLTLHDVVTVRGILSLDFIEPHSQEPIQLGLETRDCLPASVAPRIHVIDMRVEDSFTPLPVLTGGDARSTCLALLTQALDGDALAAEFLLLWCISGVVRRAGEPETEGALVGKITLALLKLTTTQASRVSSLLGEIVTRMHLMSPDLLSQNKRPFTPRKDLESNRLLSGRLQLAAGTKVVMDETRLEPRTFDEKAMHNLAVLNRVALVQKLEYDFRFFQRDQQVDEPVLVLSPSAKSPVLVTAVDCVVPVCTGPVASQPLEPSSAQLDLCRCFLEKARTCAREVDFSEEALQAAELDFVQSRQLVQQQTKIGEKDLHLWLNLARMTAATFGRALVTVDDYSRGRMLDAERRRRLL